MKRHALSQRGTTLQDPLVVCGEATQLIEPHGGAAFSPHSKKVVVINTTGH